MELKSLSTIDYDRLNAAAEDYMQLYYQIERLPPNIQHQRINVNVPFQDHMVECDVFQNSRYLSISPL